MSDKGIAKLWGLLGIAVTYLSLNVWSYTQQWRVELPAILKFDPKIGEGRITNGASIYGIMVAGPLLLLLLLLTRAFAERRRGARSWAPRIPVVGDFDVDPETSAGRRFQGAVAGLLLGVPLAAQIHFALKFVDGAAEKGKARISGLGHYAFDPATVLDGSFQYDTLSYYPFIGPWVFLLLQIGIAVAAFAALRAVFWAPEAELPVGAVEVSSRGERSG
jgi:hypothetical protein